MFRYRCRKGIRVSEKPKSLLSKTILKILNFYLFPFFIASIMLLSVSAGCHSTAISSENVAVTEKPIRQETPLLSAPAFILSDGWFSSSLAGPNQDSATFYTARSGANIIWKPVFTGTLWARVYFYKIVHNGKGDTSAQIDIIHSNKTSTRTLNLAEGESGWIDLGTFQFNANSNEAVSLTRTSSGEEFTRASAVRFDILNNGPDSDIIQSLLLDNPTGYPKLPASIPGSVVVTGPPRNGSWQLTLAMSFRVPL